MLFDASGGIEKPLCTCDLKFLEEFYAVLAGGMEYF